MHIYVSIFVVSYHSLLPNFPPKKARKSKDAKDTLRRCVENLFNRRYGNSNNDYCVIIIMIFLFL